MSIYEEIAAERAAQDAKWGGANHDDEHGFLEWIHYIVKHSTRAAEGYELGSRTSVGRTVFRRQMLRVAALAVAAIEAVDRSAPKGGGK